MRRKVSFNSHGCLYLQSVQSPAESYVLTTQFKEGSMKKLITALSGLVAGTMVVTTIWASSKEAIWAIPNKVTKDPWFIATLFDAYFGFLTFYGWVYYKETSATSRMFWFIAIMLGGNAAMSTYLLLQLAKMPDDATFKELLTKRSIAQSA